MKTCPYCGEQNDSRHGFCTSCGQSMSAPSQAFGDSTHASGSAIWPRRTEDEPQTPFAITLAHGEVIKRVFEITRVHRPFGWLYGHLVVTDSRVIYRARSKNWLNQSMNNLEIQVADVSGITLAARRGITLLNVFTIAFGTMIALTIVGGFQAVSTLFRTASTLYGRTADTPDTSGWSVFLSLLILLVAVMFFIVRAKSAEVVLVIAARDVTASPIAFSGSVGRGGFGLYRAFVNFLVSPLLAFGWALGIRDAFDVSDAAMIPATERLYEEFGALILDLQSRGVLGDE